MHGGGGGQTEKERLTDRQAERKIKGTDIQRKREAEAGRTYGVGEGTQIPVIAQEITIGLTSAKFISHRIMKTKKIRTQHRCLHSKFLPQGSAS